MVAHTPEPHIDAPELLTTSERTRDAFFTALMWGVYLYLWAPLVSFFAWWLGFEYAYDVMIRSGGAVNLSKVLTFYGIVLAAIFLTVTIWSLGNRLRYGHLHRRRDREELTLTEMAEDFGVSPALVKVLRSERTVSIEFDADGLPTIAGQEIDEEDY